MMRIIDPGRGRLDAPSAVTIGKFDGVHVGHQALLAATRAAAERAGGMAGVVTFDRHPAEILRPDAAPPALTPLPEKLRLLEAHGADFCVLLRLDTGVLGWPAERFAQSVLLETAGALAIVTGSDFRYGQGRTGTLETLEAAGFEVSILAPVLVEGARVSSFAVRAALTAGDLPLAEAMLGRQYRVQGVVGEGKRLGRTLGFPTANVYFDVPAALPKHGIYAVTAEWNGVARAAVASLGVRPTVEAGPAPVWLEVYVLDWTGDLYGKEMRVTFVQRLRDEEKFDGLDALVSQIRRDVEAARRALQKTTAPFPGADVPGKPPVQNEKSRTS